MTHRIAIAALVSALLLPAPAAAQDMSLPIIDPNILWNAAGQDHISRHLREEAARRAEKREPAPDAAPSATLTYTPSKSARRANLARFAAKLRAGDPAGAAGLEKLLTEGDFIERIGGELARYGLRTDNAADAYAAWWVNAWLGWAGDTSDQTRAQARAVSAQAGRALLATPSFVGADNAAKQEMAEILLVQAAMIGGAIDQLKTDPSQKPALRTAMAQAGAAMGLDFATMRLTATGFEPRSK